MNQTLRINNVYSKENLILLFKNNIKSKILNWQIVNFNEQMFTHGMFKHFPSNAQIKAIIKQNGNFHFHIFDRFF